MCDRIDFQKCSFFGDVIVVVAAVFGVYVLSMGGKSTTAAPLPTYQTKSQLISGPGAQSSLAARTCTHRKQCTPQHPHRRNAMQRTIYSILFGELGLAEMSTHITRPSRRFGVFATRESSCSWRATERRKRKSNRKWCGLN